MVSGVIGAIPGTLQFYNTIGFKPAALLTVSKGSVQYVYSFPESHDTERLLEEMHGNVDALRQRYLFAGVFSSGVMMPIGFEFGFRKRLHVVKTQPQDWEETDVDLTDFISRVNALKTRFRIFQEECPTQVLRYDNPAVLLMWKASVKTPEEALIILNKDPWNRQHFHAESLGGFIQGGAPLIDVSPDDPMDYVPVPFSYELRPGEGRVFVTSDDGAAATGLLTHLAGEVLDAAASAMPGKRVERVRDSATLEEMAVWPSLLDYKVMGD